MTLGNLFLKFLANGAFFASHHRESIQFNDIHK